MAAASRITVRRALALALLLGACRSLSLPAPGVAEQARVTASLSARLRVSLRGPQARGRVSVLIAFRRPDALRVEVPGPTGSRLTVVARGDRLFASFPQDRTYWEGEATAQGLTALLGVALTPSEVMDLLVGVPPASVRDYQAWWGASLPRKLTASLADGARLTAVVEDAEVGGALSSMAFEEPPRVGFRRLSDQEVRGLWR